MSMLSARSYNRDAKARDLLPAPNASALPGRAISINNTTKTNAVVGLLLKVPNAMISDDVRISMEDAEEGNESRKGE